jgi:hypothetical protein
MEVHESSGPIKSNSMLIRTYTNLRTNLVTASRWGDHLRIQRWSKNRRPPSMSFLAFLSNFGSRCGNRVHSPVFLKSLTLGAPTTHHPHPRQQSLEHVKSHASIHPTRKASPSMDLLVIYGYALPAILYR